MIVSFGAFAADAARQPVQEAGGQYKVRSGETLNQIAARIRPNNMSLAQTMQAIVQANPNVFKHGNHNLIYAGDVLRIPSSMQLKGGSSQAAPTAQTKATQETAADKGKTDNAVPAFGPKIVTGSEVNPTAATSGKRAAVEEKKVEAHPASAAVVENTKKAESAEGKKEAVPAASSAPAEKSAAPAPEAVNSSAPQAAATASAPEEQKGSTWPWILFGGAGLAALLFLSKKRGAAADKQEEEAFSAAVSSKKQNVEASSVSKAAATTTAAVGTAAAAASAVHAAEDDEVAVEDDIFFSDVKHEVVEGAGSDIDIDLDSIDGQQGIVTSMVTNDEESQKLADVDWDKIESTDSVFEDDIPPAAAPVAATYTAATEQADEPQNFASRQVAEEPLDFDEPAVADKVVETIDFEPSVEAPLAAQEPVVAEVQPVAEELDVVEPVVSNTAEWAGSGISDAKQPEPLLSSAEDTLEFIKADIEPDSGVQTVAQPFEQSIDLAGVSPSEDEGLDFVSDSKAETSASAEDLVEDISAAHIKEASEDEVIAWDSVDLSGDEEIGFISESVGMTAPLEAKFELAEMYIEIGDPDAARETLNELIDEAKGDILTKSKALLAEIS